MVGKKKITCGLKHCVNDRCGKCPYHRDGCIDHLLLDTLTLLKEPEQKYVPSIGWTRDFGAISGRWYRCGYPECGFPINRGDIYCRHCGKPIGWEPEKEWGGEYAE